MPWCPHCDEIFPEGPACPRCRAPLVEVSRSHDEDKASVALPKLKVPRRVRKAFATPAGPAQPRPLIALAMALLLFVGGFVTGRMSGMSAQPVLRGSPTGLQLPIPGAVTFVRLQASPVSSDLELYRNLVSDGSVRRTSRFSSPYAGAPTGQEELRLSGMGGSVAMALSAPQSAKLVAAFPTDSSPIFWLRGDEAAWETPQSLLVRKGQHLVRWSFADGPSSQPVEGRWSRVLQTTDGAVLESTGDADRTLARSRQGRMTPTLTLPADGQVIAVPPQADSALMEVDGQLQLWDGQHAQPTSVGEQYVTVGAEFSPDGQRVALLVRRPSQELLLAILESDGSRMLLRPVPSNGDPSCAASPVWHPSGRWVFVAPGDGSVHGLEVGGTWQGATVDSVGCSIAWAR